MTTRIGLAGDWHGRLSWAQRMLNIFSENGVSDIYQLGDFGLLPDETGKAYLDNIQATLAANAQTLFVILGNHEDYGMVEHFVTSTEHDGWMTTGSHNRILFATRGQRWNIEGIQFLAVGGANSINRYDLVEWVSWWSGEQISMADTYRAIEGGKTDIMLTHDAPLNVPILKDGEEDNAWSLEARAYAQKSRTTLQHIADVVQPEIVFHGHFHRFEDITVHTDEYTMRSVCLNMNDQTDNLAILSLPDKDLEILSY